MVIFFCTQKPLSSPGHPKQLRRPRQRTTLIVTSSVKSSSTVESEQRTLRKSTQETSRGFRIRQEEEELRQRRRVVRRPKQVRKLTQQELLAEAKWTEIDNLASLEAYARMEAEKKKVKEKKVVWSGPVVRYLSVTMPLISDADSAVTAGAEGAEPGKEEVEEEASTRLTIGASSSINTHVDNNNQTELPPVDQPVAMETDADSTDAINAGMALSSNATPSPVQPRPPQKQSRNFMVFTDTNNFPSAYFPPPVGKDPPRLRRRFCPVTGLPAKYVDPLTRTPYATPFAFKVIRMRYVSEAEEKCEKRLVQLSSWLEEKKRKKMESS